MCESPEYRTVEYSRSSPSVGDLHCSECDALTPAWRSSGMSDCFPHFYCDRCSNVLHRACDERLVRKGATQGALDLISGLLPGCPCGGQFAPGADPKCRGCGKPVGRPRDLVLRLSNPFMIVVDGACVFSDRHDPYIVRIRE